MHGLDAASGAVSAAELSMIVKVCNRRFESKALHEELLAEPSGPSACLRSALGFLEFGDSESLLLKADLAHIAQMMAQKRRFPISKRRLVRPEAQKKAKVQQTGAQVRRFLLSRRGRRVRYPHD